MYSIYVYSFIYVANRLSIGFNKTFGILHTYRTINTDDLDLSINNNRVNFYNEGLFLGITVDNRLKYCTPIDNVCKKLSKAVGIIYKLRSLNVPKNVLTQVYYSIAYPYLTYNVCSYSGTYRTHIDRILLIQKKLVRIINRAPFLAHTNELFYNSKILKIQDIYYLNIGLYMYEHRNSGVYERSHSYSTRNRNNLIPNRARLTITENSISVIGPNLWNSIPAGIQNSVSRNAFKRKYKHHLLSSYVNS